MNHNYDVINLCFDETRQKVFAQHHSELGEKNMVLSKYSVYFDKSPKFFYFGCHRTLSEGQENDRRSKTFSGSHLENNGWNSLLLFSYHLTWSD